MSADQIPLHLLCNEEAEESVLTCFLNSSAAVAKHALAMGGADFYLLHTRCVFTAIRKLASTGRPVTAALVCEALRRSDTIAQLKSKGGAKYVDDLLTAPVVDIDDHVTLLREKSKRRRLVAIDMDLRRAINDGISPDDAAETIRGRLEQFSAPASSGSGIVLRSVSDIVHSESFARPRRTLATGIPELDRRIAGGLKSREHSILAAPTGVGKTGLAGSLMLNLINAQQAALWVCTELGVEEQAARIVALARRKSTGGCFTVDDLLAGSLPIDHIAPLVKDVPIYLLRIRRRDPDPYGAIVTHAEAIAQRHGLMPAICVDYLQKLANGTTDQMRLSVSDVSEQLLDVAQRLDTCVLSISSVGRAFYNREARKLRGQPNEHPRDWLACGKESGDLEYDGAVVMFLDTGDIEDPTAQRPARLIVAKARGGGEGFYGLRFHGPSGLFVPDQTALAELKENQQKGEVPAGAVTAPPPPDKSGKAAHAPRNGGASRHAD